MQANYDFKMRKIPQMQVYHLTKLDLINYQQQNSINLSNIFIEFKKQTIN